MSNHLANETSPYLLQHKDNPVEWYPWGEAAFRRAKEEGKPVLVSIGYSACHWCHVMARESFEDPAIAAQMNEMMICIKVDREERPDVDAVYMSAVQAMSGQGGWPLNVFVDSEGVPFFGGTYWPPQDRQGMPGWPRVLRTIETAWTNDREKLTANASQMRAYLANSGASLERETVADEQAAKAIEQLASRFDPRWGGFGTAPKFPQAPVLEFLFRHVARTGNGQARAMLLTTLDRMAEGGIHDQVGGGFARYAVDQNWLTPHFEKMLYDNGQFLQLYLDAYRLTGDTRYREITRDISGWLLARMQHEGGAFYAALDADSEHVEGKYYVWTLEQLAALLDAEEMDLVRLHYGVTESGNFEHGTNILHVSRSLEAIAEASGTSLAEVTAVRNRVRGKLLAARDARIAPGLDDKIITSWNALVIKALVLAADVLDDATLRDEAIRAAQFLLENLRTEDGLLRHTWKDDQTRGDGLLEDYAMLADACITLYQVTADPRWLEAAEDLTGVVLRDFRHESGIGFYDTGLHHEQLVTRPRELQDGATPSGNAVMADVLLTLGTYRQEPELVDLSRAIVESLVTPAHEYPAAFGRILAVGERHLAPVRELVFAGNPGTPSLDGLRRVAALRYLPDVVIGYAVPGNPVTWPMMMERPVAGEASAYLCQDFTCLPPVGTAEALETLLAGSD